MDAFVRRIPRGAGEVAVSAPEQLERPSKKPRREETHHQKFGESGDSSTENDLKDEKNNGLVSESLPGDGDSHPATDFENAFPPAADETQAIEEYEAFKSSQGDAAPSGTPDQAPPRWVKGSSSIYVDAFNLALDIVLDEEASLFNTKELEIFNQWRSLDYEAQYL